MGIRGIYKQQDHVYRWLLEPTELQVITSPYFGWLNPDLCRLTPQKSTIFAGEIPISLN